MHFVRLTESAYRYVKNSGGLVQDSEYPYTAKTYEGVTGECAVDTSADVIGITGYTTIKGETNMANYVLSTGPLSVCIAAEVWNSYTGGILSVCPGGVDHCVQGKLLRISPFVIFLSLIAQFQRSVWTLVSMDSGRLAEP